MRIPSFTRRKSSKGPSSSGPTGAGARWASASENGHGTPQQQPQPAGQEAGAGNRRHGDTGISEFGVAAPQLQAVPPPRISLDQSGSQKNSGSNSSGTVRSFFKRSHSRSMSSGAQSKLHGAQTVPVRPLPATISTSGGSRSTSASGPGGSSTTTGGHHPLRQQTLPSDADSLQHSKGKRPSLFSKRTFTSSTSSVPAQSPGLTPPVPSQGTAAAHPLSDLGQASASSDSFQLKSFRSLSGVREEQQAAQPTLSSLVDSELVSSPLSTRPNSPSPSVGARSYFDSLPNTSATGDGSVTPHERSYTSGSISVAKFREARAARSSSSLASNNDRSPAPPGLRLDLPPPISMDYSSSRPMLASLQPGFSSLASPASPETLQSPMSLQAAVPQEVNRDYPVSAPAASAAFINTLSDAKRSPSPPLETLRTPHQSASPYEGRSPPSSPPMLSSSRLASHPDNALPLPPLPAEPARTPFQAHARRTSTQSVSSLSSALGGWLNNTSSNFGLSFSVEDVQRAINQGSSALRASASGANPSAVKTQSPQPAAPRHPNDGSKKDKEEEQEEIAAAVHLGPSREELHALLGGKILPPPPSETGDDLAPPPRHSAPSGSISPQRELSRTSSYTNISMLNGLSTAKNLFASGIARVAKPARDDDDTASEISVDLQGGSGLKGFEQTGPARKATLPQSRSTNLFGSSDSEADSEEDEDADSDDSEVRRKREAKARVFPPPRPLTPHERERAYRSAQTPPAVTPQGSHTDLRQLYNPLVQPLPRISALTTGALTSFNDDEEENVPLSTLRGKRVGAMSEFGVAAYRQPSAIGAQTHTRGASGPGHSSAASSLGIGTGSSTAARRSLLAAPTLSAVPATSAADGAASSAVSRSLSAFSPSVSNGAQHPKQYSRSTSSQGIPAIVRKSQTAVTLNQLIQSEMEVVAGAGQTGHTPAVPSLSSDSSGNSSVVRTPSDLSITPQTSGAPADFKKQHRTATSDLGTFVRLGTKPVGPTGSTAGSSRSGHSIRHAKTKSVPLVQFAEADEVHERLQQRQAQSHVGRSASTLGSGGSAPAHQGSFDMALSPLSSQELPPPPGVDPALYASLPADQKQALQQRSQQLMAMMQSFAIQAQNDAWGRVNAAQFATQPPQMPFCSPLPNTFQHGQMAMPNAGMGMPYNSFPSVPNFYGYPAVPATLPIQHPQQQPFVSQLPYQSSTSLSSIGMPSAYRSHSANNQQRQHQLAQQQQQPQ